MVAAGPTRAPAGDVDVGPRPGVEIEGEEGGEVEAPVVDAAEDPSQIPRRISPNVIIANLSVGMFLL